MGSKIETIKNNNNHSKNNNNKTTSMGFERIED